MAHYKGHKSPYLAPFEGMLTGGVVHWWYTFPKCWLLPAAGLCWGKGAAFNNRDALDCFFGGQGLGFFLFFLKMGAVGGR